MTRSDQRRLHLHWFCIICLVLAVLYIWADVWTDLRNYEAANDEDVIIRFCARLSDEARGGSCTKILKDANYKPNYLTLDHTGQTLARVIGGKKITYVKSEDEDKVYHIYAGSDLLAFVRLDISGYNGLLKLPEYSVVSIEATKSADYAVKSPRNMFLGDTALASLSPVETNKMFGDLEMLAQSTLDVSVPEYLVYHIDKVFDVPVISSHASPAFTYPMTQTEDGIWLVGDYPEYELTDELRAKTQLFAENLTGYTNSIIEWDIFKGDILSTSPLYMTMEAAAGKEAEPHEEVSCGKVNIAGYYAWTPSLVSVRAKYQYTVTSGDIVLNFDQDNTFYFCLCEEDSAWRVCEIQNNMPENAVVVVTEINNEMEDNNDVGKKKH